jgi:epoxyqueuosine reductase
MDYKNSIKEYCGLLGLDLVGFSKCRVFDELSPLFIDRKHKNIQNEFEEKDIDKRINPFLYMQQGKTILSIAFPYFHGFDYDDKGDFYFSKYTLGKDYHIVLSEYLKKICGHIESLGGKAVYFTDNNSLPERFLASMGGIGFIGKNNTLITEKYGSYVFLGEIITDLIMEEDMKLLENCGDCNLCINSCPTGAIAENNPNVCLSYITQKKDIEDEWFELLKGRLFGCDTCQDICPFNRNVKKSELSDFKPYSFMSDVNPEELIFLSNKEFKEKYKKTSAGWRGKTIIQRNALINLFNNIKKSPVKYQDVLDVLVDIKERINKNEIGSLALIDIYNRLLNIFKL